MTYFVFSTTNIYVCLLCELSNGYKIFFQSYMNSRQRYNHHFQFSNYQKNVIRPSFHLLFSGLESLESLESLARLSCFSSRLSRLYFCQDFGSPNHDSICPNDNQSLCVAKETATVYLSLQSKAVALNMLRF